MSAFTRNVQSQWTAIRPILSIRNEREYNLAVKRLDELLDEVGTNERDPLYSLLDTLGTLIRAYDEDHHPMPLGLFLALAGRLVAPGFGGGHAQIGDWPPILRPPDLGILAEVSDQNHLVHASRHRRSPLSNTKPSGRRHVGLKPPAPEPP